MIPLMLFYKLVKKYSDILTALKGDGSFKADHGFVVYRDHSHDFIANVCPPAPFVQR